MRIYLDLCCLKRPFDEPSQERVRRWLDARPLDDVREDELARRTGELVELGFGGFDALHLASAELAAADVLVTCDDRFLAAGLRSPDQLRVRILDPLAAARELFS